MLRTTTIIVVLAVILAMPFLLRRPEAETARGSEVPVLVVISPHNRALRSEFELGFSEWHARRYGTPVAIDWRTIGGTTEIMRYLDGEYVAAFRAWWKSQGRDWPRGASSVVLDRKFRVDAPPPDASADALRGWEALRDIRRAFLETDDSAAFSCRIDVFFGGGTYDHGKAEAEGIAVPPWPLDGIPAGLVATADGHLLIPESLGGERWRSRCFYGTALSTFGICYNLDRLVDLGIDHPPTHWSDLTDPAYVGQLGVADPTKSGSIAKAFEMIIQEQCSRAVNEAGFAPERVAVYEAAIEAARLAPGEVPSDVPAEYQAAVELGWMRGLRLVQLIGANARYVTDSSSKIPIDVGNGDAAAGIVIDFYGRFQAEVCRPPGSAPRMVYTTPVGGSSVSADPISLLRGAEHAELARRFIAYVLGEDGQKLLSYAAGTPGGPRRFALRRLPIRRDFYPSREPAMQARYEAHRTYTADPLGDPAVDAYRLAERFTYWPRWTARHFSVHRQLIRAMCLDADSELRETWRAILTNGGPGCQPRAMALLQRMPDCPEPLTWRGLLTIDRRFDALEYTRQWTIFFRASYAEARAAVMPGAVGKRVARHVLSASPGDCAGASVVGWGCGDPSRELTPGAEH